MHVYIYQGLIASSDLSEFMQHHHNTRSTFPFLKINCCELLQLHEEFFFRDNNFVFCDKRRMFNVFMDGELLFFASPELPPFFSGYEVRGESMMHILNIT